jgi:guanine nucleotide-exchange factor
LICTSVNETENGAATSSETDQSQKAEPVSNVEDHGNKPYSGNIIELLNKAGNTLEGTDAELVLNPLRLAVETKNLKILEPALDCIHVRACFLHSTLYISCLASTYSYYDSMVLNSTKFGLNYC